jgi:hypothetical protein
VEFTSGAADGPELDEAYRDLDDNFYATLLAPARLTDLAEAMHGAGWRVRKCSWSEYEASCAWAELLLAPSGNISGVAAPGHRGGCSPWSESSASSAAPIPKSVTRGRRRRRGRPRTGKPDRCQYVWRWHDD